MGYNGVITVIRNVESRDKCSHKSRIFYMNMTWSFIVITICRKFFYNFLNFETVKNLGNGTFCEMLVLTLWLEIENFIVKKQSASTSHPKYNKCTRIKFDYIVTLYMSDWMCILIQFADVLLQVHSTDTIFILQQINCKLSLPVDLNHRNWKRRVHFLFEMN